MEMNAGPGLDDIDDDQADDQGRGCDDLKIQQGLQADPPHFLEARHAGKAKDNRAEDHRPDQHRHKTDETGRKRLHLRPRRGPEMSEKTSEDRPDEHQQVPAAVEESQDAHGGWSRAHRSPIGSVGYSQHIRTRNAFNPETVPPMRAGFHRPGALKPCSSFNPPSRRTWPVLR